MTTTDYRPDLDYPTALARIALRLDGTPATPRNLAARAAWFRDYLAESTDPARTTDTTKEHDHA